MSAARDQIIAVIRQKLVGRSTPMLVAIDGPSGAGKSSVARIVAEGVGAVVVPSDDFFAATITDAEWDARTAQERARDALDWRRLRRDALEPMLAGATARWHAFDFEAGTRSDGTYAMKRDWVERHPAPVIILDGAYSTRPELSDLIDLSVFIETPPHVRRARLAEREAAGFLEAWHARWDAAEEYFFTQVRPPAAFELVVA